MEERKEHNPCSLCAKLRKGALVDEAVRQGCNVIAYAHHKDDFVETMLMSMIYQGQFYAFPPDVYKRQRYFLRFLVDDRTGILAGVAGVLGNNGVSISQVIQKPAIDGVAELVVITDKVETRHLQDALVIFGEMSMIREVASVIRVYSQK